MPTPPSRDPGRWAVGAFAELAATQGLEPQAAFQHLRTTARSASRKVAEVAQDVVRPRSVSSAPWSIP